MPCSTCRAAARARPRSSPTWLSRGVAVEGLAGYWHGPDRRSQGLVVGYGTPAEHAFPAALEALADALAELRPGLA